MIHNIVLRIAGRRLSATARRLVAVVARWEILAITLLAIPRLFWFEPNNLVARGDLIYPLQGLDFYASLNGAWRDIDLGILSVFQPRLARPLYLFSALSALVGLDLYVSETTYVFLMTWLAGAATYYLFASFVSPSPSSRIGGIAAAALYLYNTYLIADSSQSAVLYLDLYAFTPLASLLLVLGVSKRDVRYALLLGFISPVLFSYLPSYSLGALAIVAITTFWIYYLVRPNTRKIAGKFGATAIVAGLGANLFWIIPWILSSPALFAAASAFTPSESGLLSINAFASFENAIRGLSKWSFYSDYLGLPYVPYGHQYQSLPWLIAATFLVPIVSFSALLFWRRQGQKIALAGASLVLLFAAKGPNPPLGELYSTLVTRTPFVGFRESFFFVQPMVLFMAILFGLFVDDLHQTMDVRFRRHRGAAHALRPVISVLLVGLVLLTSWPLVTGEVTRNWYGPPTHGMPIPPYIWQAASFINSAEGDFRIAFLPQLPIYIAFDWGYQGGSDILLSLFSKPIILGNSGQYVASSSLELIQGLEGAIAENSTEISRLISLFNVRYVLVLADLNTTFMQLDPLLIPKTLASLDGQSDLIRVAIFGKWVIYEVPNYQASVSYLNEAVLLKKAKLAGNNTWNESWEVYRSAGFEAVQPKRSTENGLIYFTFDASNSSTVYRYSYLAEFSSAAPARWLSLEFSTNDDTTIVVAVRNSTARDYLEAREPTLRHWGNYYQDPSPASLAFRLPDWFSTGNTIEIYLVSRPGATPSFLPRAGFGQIAILASLGVIEDIALYLRTHPNSSPIFVEDPEILTMLGSPGNSTIEMPLSRQPPVILTRTGKASFRYDVTGARGTVLLVLPQSYSDLWRIQGPGEILFHNRANLYANLWLVNFTGDASFYVEYRDQALSETIAPLVLAIDMVMVVLMASLLTVHHLVPRRNRWGTKLLGR